MTSRTVVSVAILNLTIVHPKASHPTFPINTPLYNDKLSLHSLPIDAPLTISQKRYKHTVEALVSGHPRDAKKVFVTGAGHLREFKNTEFVWELRKTHFVKVAISRAFQLRERPLGEHPMG